jgi:transcriptional regulator with XRE-family HTH domain
MSLEQKVRMLREKKGINQKKLAELSDLTQATISRIESGQVKELKSEALKRLANALGTTVDFLVGKTNKVTPGELLAADPDAHYLFRGYEKLSPEGRSQLKNFVQWLENKEKKEKRDET